VQLSSPRPCRVLAAPVAVAVVHGPSPRVRREGAAVVEVGHGGGLGAHLERERIEREIERERWGRERGEREMGEREGRERMRWGLERSEIEAYIGA